MKLTPPCRVYLYFNGPQGRENITFDVCHSENPNQTKYKVKLVENKVRRSPLGPYALVEKLSANEVLVNLSDFEKELTNLMNSIKWHGWKHRVLPLENRIKF